MIVCAQWPKSYAPNCPADEGASFFYFFFFFFFFFCFLAVPPRRFHSSLSVGP
jgi:hypothetical protein